MTDERIKDQDGVVVEIDEEVATVFLTDENGEDIEFEVLGYVEYDGEEYSILLPADQADEEEPLVEILKIEVEDGEEVLVSVEDMDLMQEVFNIFIDNYEANRG